MSLLELSIAPATGAEVSGSDEILRFRDAERHLHWAIAIPFKICYLTAVILVLVYNPHPTRPFREVVSWIHRLSGVSLAILPPFMIARHWRDVSIHLSNIRQGWTWRLDDLKWLLLMGPATLNRNISLPHQGKFNAGEKINFIAVMCTYPMYILSGLMIWFSSVPYLPWLVHFSLAVLTTPLVLGHIFMATVNPDTRTGLQGMLSGFVDRQWAKHHYRLWYDEHHGDSPKGDALASSAERRPLPAPLQFPVRSGDQRAILRPGRAFPVTPSAATTKGVPATSDQPGTPGPDESDSVLDRSEPAAAVSGRGNRSC